MIKLSDLELFGTSNIRCLDVKHVRVVGSFNARLHTPDRNLIAQQSESNSTSVGCCMPLKSIKRSRSYL